MTTLPKNSDLTGILLKRLIVLFSCTLLSFNLGAQQEISVLLRWKIAPKDSLMYNTTIKTIETSEDTTELNETDKALIALLKTSLQVLIGADENTPLVSKISRQKSGMAISMFYQKSDSTKNAMKMMYEQTFKGFAKNEKVENTENQDSLVKEILQNIYTHVDEDAVMLEGNMNDNGSIGSFYIDKNQKNTLALFFELPTKNVKIGDSWALDVQFTLLNSAFECDSVFKKNQVTLTQIKKQGQDSVAVLAYNIQEYVSGKYPADAQKSFTKTRYQAVAEFSITQGRWLSYEGQMETDSFGSVEHKKYALTKID